jgi:hypothetical protein
MNKFLREMNKLFTNSYFNIITLIFLLSVFVFCLQMGWKKTAWGVVFPIWMLRSYLVKKANEPDYHDPH